MQGWDRWSKALPTEKEAELWDRLWQDGHRSVGLVLGEASGVVALDLDSDDPELLAMAPLSPVSKRGSKGETRFFRPCEGVATRHPNGLDILWTGTQTVLPPSPHPKIEGKPYVWLTPDTFETLPVTDLPVIDLTFVDRYVKTFESKYPNLCKKSQSGHSVGRNNWLKDVVWAKRIAQESEEDIVESVYQMDLYKNSPRLFMDSSEGFQATSEPDARLNAWRFVTNVTKTFIGRRAGEAPVQRLPEILILGEKKQKGFEPIPYPEPKGMLGDLYHTCLKMSVRHQPGISIGGAIAIGSIIIANRFRLGRMWPNIYVINIAPTGAGKSFPQSLANSLLMKECESENLYGFGDYQSSVAITKNLDRNRERLDIIDEASSLFNAIAEGGVFQKNIDDILCKLYTCSNTLFAASESMGKESMRVWHPCVSILMSITPAGLKSSISKSLATKGFFPRCLPFIDGYGKQKDEDESFEADVVRLGREVRDLRARTARPASGKGADLINIVPNPIDIPCSAEATALLKLRKFEWGEMLTEANRTEIDRGFLSRASEQAKKLALIHGALRAERVDLEDVLWAIALVESVRTNTGLLFPQLGAENRTQSNIERVYALVAGVGIISHKDLIARTRFLQKRERNEILDSLVEEGKLHKTEAEKGTVWAIV